MSKVTTKPCESCGGTGVREVHISGYDIYAAWDAEVVCEDCEGTGVVEDDDLEDQLRDFKTIYD